MPENKSFMDDFYSETMTEMAENFFTRRRELETRMEGFARLSGEVRSYAVKALRRWRTFCMLLADDARTAGFLRRIGVDPGEIPAIANQAGEPWHFKPQFALTARGRYRKSVRYAYRALRQATQDYMEGCYGTDPKNPKKKIVLPNYFALRDMAEQINREVATVNTAQCPSSVLSYAKSLDPSASEREAVMGGMVGEDVCRLDESMAFHPVDFSALELPELPVLPPLDDVEDALDEACCDAYGDCREAAQRALAYITGP
ncbi:hypothetical protein [Fundidesulfovibrio terrae]|uniref:hypothetical protein n=1 Tax=Fundidesulfovibrio terrae TaxID=2922866 RepID=UPI001FAF28D2|nr:hypothetical protein [Fundidesulfovibrio terrae]